MGMEKGKTTIPNIEVAIWTVGFVFHRRMSGLKRNSKRLMMIVRVPKRQKPSRNGGNGPYPRLNLNTIKDYIVITYVHQNPNFPPRIRKKN